MTQSVQPNDVVPPVDVDQIVKEIRQEILREEQKRLGVEPVDLNLVGEGLSPDFYASLWRAELMYRDLRVEPEIAPSTVPIVGPLIDRFKGMLHQLVLHYTNVLLAEQVSFNRHLIRLISQLSVELEQAKKDPAHDA